MAKEQISERLIDVMTPVGKATFVKINGMVDEFHGSKKYTASMNLSEEAAKQLEEQLIEIWENSATYAARVDAGKEVDRPKLGMSKHPQYGHAVKATTLTEFTNEDGKVNPNIIPIVDENEKPMDSSTKIWGGSKVKLWVGAKPYQTPTGLYGVTLKLKGIMVIDLKTGGNGGFVFGGTAANQGENTEVIPF